MFRWRSNHGCGIDIQVPLRLFHYIIGYQPPLVWGPQLSAILNNMAVHQGLSGLSPRYVGPFKILKQISPVPRKWDFVTWYSVACSSLSSPPKGALASILVQSLSLFSNSWLLYFLVALLLSILRCAGTF